MYTIHHISLYIKVVFDQVAAQDKGGRLCFTPPASFFHQRVHGTNASYWGSHQCFCTGLTHPTVIKWQSVYM